MTTQTEPIYDMDDLNTMMCSEASTFAVNHENTPFYFVLLPIKHAQTERAGFDGVGPINTTSVQADNLGQLKVVKQGTHPASDECTKAQPDRRLLTVLVVDAVGYCRLMYDDECTTVSNLIDRKALMIREIHTHGGRVVDSPGDNIMATFASVIAAVRCAATLQTRLEELNRDMPETQCMRFRMGIHLGDVICRGPSIFGNAVNIAARLQSIAEPGGIRISRSVYDLVEGKLPLMFQCLGEQHLKNIPAPVTTYRIAGDSEFHHPDHCSYRNIIRTGEG